MIAAIVNVESDQGGNHHRCKDSWYGFPCRGVVARTGNVKESEEDALGDAVLNFRLEARGGIKEACWCESPDDVRDDSSVGNAISPDPEAQHAGGRLESIQETPEGFRDGIP
jgi:hypothetical protein